ncbi:hypothetical protein GCM10010462_06990 [Microbacterium dextranolyticum]|uniref:Uncharacterized protein n=1 Tax=Microbacterium dextranolyticum TaxID=36806 RepID=A0A9W6HP69_9MICO|nr:hypothetical protein GCM10017591_21660 [Microbacterium dextranolyticum]
MKELAPPLIVATPPTHGASPVGDAPLDAGGDGGGDSGVDGDTTGLVGDGLIDDEAIGVPSASSGSTVRRGPAPAAQPDSNSAATSIRTAADGPLRSGVGIPSG